MLNHFLIRADDNAHMGTTLRQPASAGLDPERPTVEDLIGRIADLVLLRQSLRASGAEQQVLEDNRCALVAAHWDLSRALIDRHCRSAADPAPAAA
jgi:hypothetical protein